MVNNPINESLIDLDESQTSDTNKRSEDQTSRIKENKKLISSLNILKSLAKSYLVILNLQKKKLTNEFKENLLNDLKKILQNEGYLTFHEKNANKLWKITIDYRNAVKEQWSKLRLLRKEDIEEIPSEKLKSLSKLRENMALYLYISNKFIEVQLYALAAIQLQLKNSQKVTRQDFIGAKKIFDKVKGGDPMADTRENDDSMDVEETPELDTEINIEDRSEHTIALVKTVDQEFSFFGKKTIQNSINNDMAKVTSGVAAMGGAMTVRISVTVAACFNIYEAVAIIGVTSIGGPFALIGGLLALGLGIWAGINLWKRENKLLKEPKICEKLNEIMVNALKAYDKGEYRKFIDAFSEEFKKDGSLKIRKTSDGIAYLLNLLGEVLCSEKIKIKGKVPKDLKELAMKAFDGVLNEKLENEARRLDDRIHELQEKNHIASMLSSKFRDFVSLEEYKSIAQEHKDDSQEMPFQSRLEEMHNITKINQAIFILDAGKEEIERAIKTIKEV
ncbi:unnamed protein product [Rhizophagus irregularis]|nr:unnamed protein product [Rhizophagus irregularis]